MNEIEDKKTVTTIYPTGSHDIVKLKSISLIGFLILCVFSSVIYTQNSIIANCLFQKTGASSAFVWSGGGVAAGGGQEQAAAQPAAVPTGQYIFYLYFS